MSVCSVSRVKSNWGFSGFVTFDRDRLLSSDCVALEDFPKRSFACIWVNDHVLATKEEHRL